MSTPEDEMVQRLEREQKERQQEMWDNYQKALEEKREADKKRKGK